MRQLEEGGKEAVFQAYPGCPAAWTISWNLLLLAFVLGIGGTFQYGLQVSIINPPAEHIKSFISEIWLERYSFPLSDKRVTLLWSSIVSIYSIGGLLGSTYAGYFSIRFGRKKAMLFVNIPALLGAALMGFSKVFGSFEMILLGRFFSGVCAGLGLNIHLMYVGECAPKKLRGVTAITASTAIAIGKFVGFAIGLEEILGAKALWPILMGASAIPALIQMVTLPFFPDSPRYLLIDKKDKEGCIKAMKQLWGDNDHVAEIEDMIVEQEIINGEKAKSVLDLFRDQSVRWQLITLFLVCCCLQLIGINAVYFYAYDIFMKAGISVSQIRYVSLGTGITEVITTILCGFLIERAGRKSLLWTSYATMALALGLLTATLSLQERSYWIPYCSVVLIFIFIMSFGIGPAGVSCPLPTEIFIQSYRPAAYVFCGASNWIQLFIIGLVFPFIVVQYQRLFQMYFVLGIGGNLLCGFQISVINYPSMHIKRFINETWLERYSSPLHQESLTLLWSLIVSIYCVGGLIGCLCIGYLSEKYGKKKCLLFNCVLIIIAALHVGFSKPAKSFEMILIGRALYGLSAGVCLNVHIQYSGEISPKKLRGFANTLPPVFFTLGKALGQIMGLRELLGTESLWHLLLASCGIGALFQLIFLPFFPESPPYLLIQKGDKEGCLKAMKQLWGEGNHQEDMDDLMKEKAALKSTKTMGVLELIKEPSLRWQMNILILLVMTLQLSGLNAIYFYTFEVFRTARLDEDLIPYISLGVGICELFSMILCSSIIDRFGRRILLWGGYWLMALVLILLVATLLLKDQFFWMSYCSVILIFLFIVAYGTGPAGASISVMIEIFNQAARSSALVISGTICWVGLIMIGMIFPFIVEALGPFCFLIFTGVLVISGILTYLFLPETKGKSVMEITEEFSTLHFGKNALQIVGRKSYKEYTCTKL
ncbi:PREDICTED: solute carrier family 2, facilitated glucose transporter member 11-like isoform X1 [Gavialis gangeticus]|uniref:solute carrier family 2, facilitated glucose transporter member 11-like isoform X1 n=1 Tax=Gavialis gangeticus TaxID=94835 RepID=UPI00092E467D|nr:PREDICTED: solute carrier family 2, facilitated glucose transporter member 11-like isoform X1 [Gavialis gangeticus]